MAALFMYFQLIQSQMKSRPAAVPATPELAREYAAKAKRAQSVGIICLVALIALGLVWELFLNPVHPGGSWLALKVLPLLAALRGFFAGRRYTFQWMSLLVWIYFTEGIVSATSSTGSASIQGWIATVLTVALFAECSVYARMTEASRQAA